MHYFNNMFICYFMTLQLNTKMSPIFTIPFSLFVKETTLNNFEANTKDFIQISRLNYVI